MTFKKADTEVLRRGTDYASGWEIGFNRGRERFCRRLRDRRPPDHIEYDPRNWRRRDQWYDGYRRGLVDRKLSRTVYVVCRDSSGETQCITYLGISHNRAIRNVIKKGYRPCSGGYFRVQTADGPIHDIH